jgi:hypothetical protein
MLQSDNIVDDPCVPQGPHHHFVLDFITVVDPHRTYGPYILSRIMALFSTMILVVMIVLMVVGCRVVKLLVHKGEEQEAGDVHHVEGCPDQSTKYRRNRVSQIHFFPYMYQLEPRTFKRK